MKVGLCLNTLELPFRKSLPTAATWGVQTLELEATGELAPQQLTGTGVREIRNLLNSFRLDVAAIASPLRRGIDVAADQQPRLDYLRSVIQFASQLNAPCVVLPLPRLPEDNTLTANTVLKDALEVLGSAGDHFGVNIALEGGLDPAGKVVSYLKQFPYASLQFTFDPANFLLHGMTALPQLTELGDKLAHFHARDLAMGRIHTLAGEVKLGAGDIEWIGLLTVLGAMQYPGTVCVERNQCPTRQADAKFAVEFLRKYCFPERIQARVE